MENKSLFKSRAKLAKWNKMKNQISLIFALTLLTLQANSQTQNYFAGSGAGSGNTGSSCVGVGYQALNNSNSGWRNTAIGFWALKWNSSGSSNTAVGYGAMLYNSTGQYNTSLGELALRSNEIGNKNVAVGYAALYSNVSGPNSVAVGHSALHFNQVGNNVAVGCSTLYKNEFGNDNTALGNYSLENSLAGLRNTAIGSEALRLDSLGNNNTALGRRAGFARQKYSNCTFLGAESDATATAFSNSTAIGYLAKVDGSNKVRVGNTSITSIGGQVGWTTLSDLRLKENIKDSKLGLDFILNLHAVTYNYKDEGQRDILYTGLIAQEVDAAAKKEGVEFSGVDKNGEYWGIRYAELTVPLIKSVQELNEELKNQNTNQQLAIGNLQKENQVLQKENTSMQLAIGNLQNENQTLKNEIADMRSCLEILCNNSGQTKANSQQPEANSFLNQNNPNPFKQNTTIGYYISSDSGKALIKIFSMNGEEIRSIVITTKGKGQIEIAGNSLAPGVYTYVLIVNYKTVDTKQMVVTK